MILHNLTKLFFFTHLHNEFLHTYTIMVENIINPL